MKFGVTAGVASTLLLSVNPALGSPPEQPEVVTICQLNAHPSVYDGKSVRLSARILTDAIEDTDAADAYSKDLCAVSIHYGSNPASEQHVSALREAVFKAHHASTQAHELLVVAQAHPSYPLRPVSRNSIARFTVLPKHTHVLTIVWS